jgi:chemotaxis protein CheZ
MPVQRKRFRIEETGYEAVSMQEMVDASPMPYHNEIMSELRAIRAQMGTPNGEEAEKLLATRAASMQATLDAYRAQIEQCEKLKVELDLIHEAINRTKREIAVLHGKSFSGDEMTKVTDEAASAMGKPQTADQQARLSQDIQERVITIFEACNFQDLTGQRISKVMTTMKFIEHHINVMMEIWGGVDAIKAHAPPIVDERVGDARLLNGPKAVGEEGHASQGDIDAMFG